MAKNEITKQEFTTMILALIYFSDRLSKLIPACEMKIVYQAIDIMRFWSQFAPNNDKKEGQDIFPPSRGY